MPLLLYWSIFEPPMHTFIFDFFLNSSTTCFSLYLSVFLYQSDLIVNVQLLSASISLLRTSGWPEDEPVDICVCFALFMFGKRPNLPNNIWLVANRQKQLLALFLFLSFSISIFLPLIHKLGNCSGTFGNKNEPKVRWTEFFSGNGTHKRLE